MRPSPIVLLAAVAASLQLGCTEPNPLYCTSHTQCMERDSSRPFCNLNPAEGQIGNRCMALPGDAGDMCQESAECAMADQPICDPDFDFCRGCDSVTGDSECAARDQDKGVCATDGRCVQCETSTDCPATATPICSAEMCMACTEDEAGDTACADREEGLDYCSGGSCVACREDANCPAEAPVCDDDSQSCRTCQTHGECDSEICNPDNGQCVPAGDVLYVATNGTDGSTCGGATTPCQTVSGASGALPKLGARRWIKVRGGNYTESVLVSGGQTVTLIGAGSTATVFEPPSSSPGIRIDNSSNVTIIDMAFERADPDTVGTGVRCVGTSTIRLLRMASSRNSRYGVEADVCARVTIERSKIDSNDRGGIDLEDSAFVVTNNFITNNGDAANSTVGGIRINNSGAINPQTLEFNTIARNQAQSGTPTGAACTGTDIIGRYNILWGGINSTTNITGNCSWRDNDIEGGFSGGNLEIDPQFVSPTTGNFHLMPGSMLEGEADNGTSMVDFDGDPRPLGTGRDMGADEIAP